MLRREPKMTYTDPREKGENVRAIVFGNAEGNFLPPVCIFKGVNIKPEWENKMPPRSFIAMSKKSSYRLRTAECKIQGLNAH